MQYYTTNIIIDKVLQINRFNQKIIKNSFTFTCFECILSLTSITEVKTMNQPKTILFQGDSITEAQRFRLIDPAHMGSGYALMVAGTIGCEDIGKYRFINRGISGNKSCDVLERIQEDIIDIAPDYMSLMVGVNDVWHEIDYHTGVPAENTEKNMETIIVETLKAHPKCKIMLLEPYLLKEYETVSTEEKPDKWEVFSREVKLRQEITKRLAEKYNLKFIPLQDKFDRAAEETGVAYWSIDGVHPTPMGHKLICDQWIKAFREIEE